MAAESKKAVAAAIIGNLTDVRQGRETSRSGRPPEVMLTGIVVSPLVIALAALVAWRAVRGGTPAFVVAMRVLLVLYLGWVAGATLLPLPVRPLVADLESAGRGVTVQLVPLASIRDVLLHGTAFTRAWILGGNVLTLAPLGFLLPFAAPRLASWWRMAVVALLFPLAVELLQPAASRVLGYSYRVTEVDDVLLNFVGVLLGYAAYVAVRAKVSLPATNTGVRPGAGSAPEEPWTGPSSSSS